MTKGTKARSHEATEGTAETQKRRNAENEGSKVSAVANRLRHEGTKIKATEPQSHEATEGKLFRTATVMGRGRLKFKVQSSKFETGVLTVFMVATMTVPSACVRRTISITTEPPNARVFLNDQEVGRSAVTTDFLWYGDYGVTIRKEGYETLQTNWTIKPPWYQHIPLDFFTEVLWPGHLHDTHSRHFILELAKIPTQEELIGRASETRDRALDSRK